MNKVGFYLTQIETDQFATIEKDFEKDAEYDINIHVSINFGVDFKLKVVKCLVDIKLIHDNTPIIVAKVNCYFKIEQLAWKEFHTENKKSIKLPSGFLQHLAVITVGTARGVIHSKTEKTSYNKYYLPTIDVREIVSEDREFKIETKK